MTFQKVFIGTVLSLLAISTSYATQIDYTSVSLFENNLRNRINNPKVADQAIELVRYNFQNFIAWFISKYDVSTSAFYNPISIAEAVMPSVFYKAYNAFIKMNNEENPYLTTDRLINKEREVINEYRNWAYRKYLKYVNLNVLNNVKNGNLYSVETKSIDPITLVKYDTNYNSKEINNPTNFIPTNTEIKGEDYLKNKLWIKNNKCYNYQTCAKKSFIGNNANNIPENSLDKVDINTMFNNNIRALTLWQSKLFIWDFIVSKYLATVYKKDNGSIYNKIDLFNKKSIDYKQSLSDNTNTIKIYNKLLNLKLLNFNALDLVNRYYSKPSRVLSNILGCSIHDTVSNTECSMIKNSDRGKTATLMVKKWIKKTTLLAFVSALDLPSVYVDKLDWTYYPSKFEHFVYNRWIYDNIYTHNGLFSEDFAKLVNMHSANEFKNWFSAIQWKWLEWSRNMYQNKANVARTADYATIMTVNWTWTGSSNKNIKWFALNFFPTLTFTWFKIELDNNSNTIKNVLDNPNSEYNNILNKINTLYTPSYNIWTNHLKLKDQIFNNNVRAITWKGVSTGDWYQGVEYKLRGDTIHFVPNYNDTPKDNKALFSKTISDYRTITAIHNNLDNIIKKLDKETITLYKIFMANPSDSNYKNFTDKYAEQLVYSSLYNTVKKLYYPIKFAYENKVFSWFTNINGTIGHVSFVSSIIYNVNTTNSFTKNMVNNYRKVLNKIESYHYVRKNNQMVKDGISNKQITNLIDSYSTLPANKAEAKMENLMNILLDNSSINPIVKEAQRRYTKIRHSIYSSVDYNKFSKFINASDKFYNNSEMLSKLNETLDNKVRNYYTMDELYNLRTNLPDVYDLSDNNIVEIR